MIGNNKQLCELYLYFNKLCSNFGINIGKGLCINNTLKVLDLSGNSLGSNQFLSKECATSLSEMLSINKTLVHLDLSFNQFNAQNSEIIRTGLEKNSGVLGIHFEGNNSQFKCNNHCQIEKSECDANINKININSVHKVNSNGFSTCWICQGWTNIETNYIKKIFKMTSPIYLHLSYDNYQPHIMTQETPILAQTIIYQKQFKFTSNVVVPPGIMYYYFSSPSSNEFDIIEHEPFIETTFIQNSTGQNIPKVVNIRKVEGDELISVDNWTYTIHTPCVPRESQKLYKLNSNKDWFLKDSFWSEFNNIQDENIEMECFQCDWKYQYKMIENLFKYKPIIELIQRQFKQNYQIVLLIFTKYIAQEQTSTSDTLITLSLASYLEIFGLLLDSNFTKKQLNTLWEQISININGQQQIYRDQFIQIIIEISNIKYKANSEDKLPLINQQSIYEITAFFNDKVHHPQQFRDDTLYTQKIDKLIKDNESKLKELYIKLDEQSCKQINFNKVNEEFKKQRISSNKIARSYHRSLVLSSESRDDSKQGLNYGQFVEFCLRLYNEVESNIDENFAEFLNSTI